MILYEVVRFLKANFLGKLFMQAWEKSCTKYLLVLVKYWIYRQVAIDILVEHRIKDCEPSTQDRGPGSRDRTED